ncbi:MAG: hypothetical protein ABI609_18945 [Acidobacteriota bacterium]
MRALGLAALSILLIASAGSADPLSLRNGRFEVDVHWSAGSQQNAAAAPVSIANDSGYFTFFDPSNVEILVKVLEACGQPSPGYWVFAAGLTNVEVTIDVTDRWTGEHHTFHNAAGTAFPPIQRTDLFHTCGAPQPCGSGSAADLSATPREDEQAELIALFLDREAAARQSTYDRVRADLAAIRTAHPALSAYSFLPKFDTQSLIVTVTPAAFQDITNHNYPWWDCLNAWYDLTSIEPLGIGNIGYYEVPKFSKRLFIPVVANDYHYAPGVLGTGTNTLIRLPEFPYQDLCATRHDDDEIAYFFYGGAQQQFRSRSGEAPEPEAFDNSAAAACAAANLAG